MRELCVRVYVCVLSSSLLVMQQELNVVFSQMELCLVTVEALMELELVPAEKVLRASGAASI